MSLKEKPTHGPKQFLKPELYQPQLEQQHSETNLRQINSIRERKASNTNGVRRRSFGEKKDGIAPINKPDIGKQELEEYIKQVTTKTRELAKLCQITTIAEASKFSLKLVLFEFKEISSLLMEIMDRLSNQVEVSEIYEAAINLTTTEKHVLTSLEALRTSGTPPDFGEALKTNLLNLLAAIKKAASEYAQALAKEPLPLVLAIPGFRAELGKYSKPTLQNTINYRMSYSFSASASVSKLTDNQEIKIVYADYKLDHVDNDANFYRKFFYKQEHRNYLAIDEKFGPIAISVKKESTPKKDSQAVDEDRFRAIFRTKEGCDLRTVFPSSSVIVNGMRSKPSWNDVILTINPSVQSSKLKRIEDPKLQDELLRFDEHQLVKKYKFGILYCKSNQKKEEEMFGNEHGSPEFEEFLNFIGKRIPLKGHTGHNGGLDKKNDTTGTHSVYETWRDVEVMFHVSTLLPFSTSPDDKQQIQRKRHIGNDIVMIAFIEGKDAQWNPLTIKSQFLHIFITVNRIPSTNGNIPRYRVAVISNEDVPEFGPDVPKPNEFDQTDEFKHFLFAKMINGENAAYKAPKFKEPHVRARQGLVEHLVEAYCNSQLLKSTSSHSHMNSLAVNPTIVVSNNNAVESSKQSPRSPGTPITPQKPEEFKAGELFISEKRKSMLDDIKRGSALKPVNK